MFAVVALVWKVGETLAVLVVALGVLAPIAYPVVLLTDNLAPAPWPLRKLRPQVS